VKRPNSMKAAVPGSGSMPRLYTMLQEFSERLSRQAGLSSRARVSSLGVKAISAYIVNEVLVMRSKITVAIIAALLSGATLAGDALPSAKFSELNWLPASPAQLQVLGLGNTPVPASWVDTYKGLPVSRHQLEALGCERSEARVAKKSGDMGNSLITTPAPPVGLFC
jgi:hypothetical protein